MDNTIIGYKWKNHTKVIPSIVEATAVTGEIPQVLGHNRTRPLWILDYEFADYGRYRVKSVSHEWRPRKDRTAHLYPPDTPYWEDTRKFSGRRSSTWIIFTGGTSTGINKLCQLKGYACFLDPEEKLGQNIRSCAEIGERYGEKGYWEAQSMLCEAIGYLVNSQHISEETYIISKEGVSKKIIFSDEVDALLKELIAEKVRLQDLAKHLHVSVSSLSHQYKKERGLSPIAGLIRLRINYSKTLLSKGYPLKVIAKQLGFSDAFHFSKTFKLIEGISPRGFIKRTDLNAFLK
jgi:AraC-like DNA-binding protein